MLTLDGSSGEGGGQVLRSALTLSLLTGKAFKLYNIRAKRKKPGLMPQHLACVKACQELSDAYTEGDKLYSQVLVFDPKTKPMRTNYTFDIGTAGATTLLFQTIFLPLSYSQGGTIILKGGTHVPHSPTFHYLTQVYLPMLSRFGFKAELSLERAGFYPKGGGKIRAKVAPVKELRLEASFPEFTLKEVLVFSLITKGLPDHILKRQINSALDLLKTHLENHLKIETKEEVVESDSLGTTTFILCKAENLYAGFSSLGAKGLPAEEVGKAAAKPALDFLKSGAQTDPHLADQLILPLSYLVYLGKCGPISYTTFQVTLHLITQAWLIPQFLEGIRITIIEETKLGVVTIARD